MIAFAQWAVTHAASAPTRIALMDASRSVSYGDLATRSAGLARWLRDDLGLAPGARVAWLGHNAIEQIELLLACARAGLVLVPLNWRLDDSELAAIAADAGVVLAIVDASCASRTGALSAVPRHVAVGFAAQADACLPWPPVVHGDVVAPAAGWPADTPVLLVYTSGTTGRPKGAVHTHGSVLFNALNAIHMHDLRADDRVLTVLPMFHVGGLNIQTLPALCAGATVRIESRFDPARTLALIGSWRPTLTLQVPSTLLALMADPAWADADLSCLRAIATGSTDVPVPVIEAIHARGVPVIQIYGATETGPVAIYQRIEEAFTTVGSIGRAGLHTEIRLVKADGSQAGAGEPGEIHVRGPHVAHGYWDADLRAPAPFPDGWFVSGDVASRDAGGLYWFTDRVKHVIISGGENIYPAELERVLATSPLLREAAVAGRADARWGEVPVVVAVAAREGVSRDDVLASFDGHLARYKHPRDVVFVDALPRNALGKVEVPRLRELLRGA